jgi:branched-chain amino acid transport system substrate-binding protein
MLERKLTAFAVGALIACSSAMAQQVRGVTDTEIVIGSHQALSGPLAGFGVPVAEGLRMRFDEVNESGGIHGRKVKLIVEDNQFNPARSAQVANKLLNSDNVFAIIGSLGTPPNVVVMQEAFKVNVPNLFPAASGRQMFEPFHRLKFAIQAPHYDLLRGATKFFIEQRGKKAVCLLVQENDFGREIASGAEAQLKAVNMPLVAQASHRPSDTDFSAQLTKLRDAKCDLVVIGTVIADTIGIMSTAKRMGWNVDLVGSSSPFTPETISLAQGATEGLYAMTQFEMPYPDTGNAFARDWFTRYSKRFGHPPGFQGIAGYVSADLFVSAANRAGRNLNVDTLVAALEATKGYLDPFESGPPISFGPEKRLGVNQGFLVQVQKGRWARVTGNLAY